MRRHAKASSAESNLSQGNGLGSFRRGAFVSRGASGERSGSGAPSRRARTRFPVLLCLIVLAAMALFASGALAAKTHPYTGTSFGPDGTAATSFANLQSLAVDQASGDVFAYDAGEGGKVYKFDATATPVKFAGLAGNAIADVGGGGGNGEYELAIAPVGSPGGTAGDIYVANNSESLRIFSAAGEPLGEIAMGGETCGVAVNPAGHVFVGIYTDNSVREYVPSANPVTAGDKTATSTASLPNICNVAADGLGGVYAANYTGAKGVVKLDGIGDATATAFAPGASTLTVDPSSDDVYADRGGSISQYDSSGSRIGNSGSGQLSNSHGVAVNGGSDQIYAGNGGSGKIDVFGPSVVIPGVTPQPPSGVTGSKATLHATVNPAGLTVSECKFEYGTDTGYGATAPCEGATPADEADHPVTAGLTGLAANTTYHFRVVATNANGSDGSDDQTFTTPRPALTMPATDVRPRKATLNGTVFPEGEAVSECFFEYGESEAYGATAPCEGATPADEAEHPVSAAISGLTANTTYHFRLVIQRSAGTVQGADQGFTTEAIAATGPAIAVAPPTATLEGTVNPAGALFTACSFEYGLTDAYGTSVPCAESPAAIGSGENAVPVHADLSGIAFGNTYHYRLSTISVAGPVHGEDLSFSTPGATIAGTRASNVGTDEATLEGTVNPKGSPTAYRFEYGTDNSYGSSTSDSTLGEGEEGKTVAETLVGLTPGTVYHWRLIATSPVGVSKGPDRTFTTRTVPGAPETACSNQIFRANSPSAGLPDCRAYEQASPVDKNGANIQHEVGVIQAAAAGHRITFGDLAGLPSAGSSEIFVASRGADGWTTQGLNPVVSPTQTAGPLGWDEEINFGVSQGGDGIFLSDISTKSFDLALELPHKYPAFAYLAGFSSDPSHLIFESKESTTPEAPDPSALGENTNLYDLNHGTVSLVGRIPIGAASFCDDASGPPCQPGSSGANAGAFFAGDGLVAAQGGAADGVYTQNTISRDGRRVVFTDDASGQLYVREDGIRTHQVSASQANSLDPNGAKPASFVGATPTDSKVFFTSCEKLTDDSTAVSTAADSCTEVAGQDQLQGQDLYVYDTQSHSLEDLTVDASAGDHGAAVIGVLGISDDASYVYFAANGVLANGAIPGNCSPKPNANVAGECNIYLLHDGSVKLVTKLSFGVSAGAFVDFNDADNWRIGQAAGFGRFKTARVSAGGTLLFSASGSLTGYDSGGHQEIYRYGPSSQALQCVSCNPTGAASVEGAKLETPAHAYGNLIRSTVQTRNLSADGNRVFFDSTNALVAADKNSVSDPYEWEADGSGSCKTSRDNGGCLYLLSSGESPQPSFFGDASRTGDDAFIFTTQSLVPGDKDQLVDAYDVRVGGGLASQNALGTTPCSAEACRGTSTAPSDESSPATAGFSGNGNEKPPKRCGRHGKRCSRHKNQRKHKHHKQHRKTRSAHPGRGGSK